MYTCLICSGSIVVQLVVSAPAHRLHPVNIRCVYQPLTSQQDACSKHWNTVIESSLYTVNRWCLVQVWSCIEISSSSSPEGSSHRISNNDDHARCRSAVSRLHGVIYWHLSSQYIDLYRESNFSLHNDEFIERTQVKSVFLSNIYSIFYKSSHLGLIAGATATWLEYDTTL